jgi:hypothetical protein
VGPTPCEGVVYIWCTGITPLFLGMYLQVTNGIKVT